VKILCLIVFSFSFCTIGAQQNEFSGEWVNSYLDKINHFTIKNNGKYKCEIYTFSPVDVLYELKEEKGTWKVENDSIVFSAFDIKLFPPCAKCEYYYILDQKNYTTKAFYNVQEESLIFINILEDQYYSSENLIFERSK